jgi:RNA polymerase sigma-70 factor, ECF subfamily
MSPPPETQLIERCRDGQADAWSELFAQYYPAVGRLVFQLSADFTREDAEEICQEVFLSVVKNLGSFNGRSRLQTWIFRIAINEARDYRQRQCAAKRGGGVGPLSLDAEDPATGLTLDPPGVGLAPDGVLLRAEELGLVSQALAQLSRPDREVLELRYFGDLSYEEIAHALELNPRTVSSRLSRSLDRLEVVLRGLLATGRRELSPA